MNEKILSDLQTIRSLANIPSNDGEQFIDVLINVATMTHGEIRFGFDWKKEMGEYYFHSLDEAIEELKGLRKQAKL